MPALCDYFLKRPKSELLLALIVFAASMLAMPIKLMAETQQPNAAVIMYHRFGEDNYPTTNVSLEQFDAHLNELQSGGYSMVSLLDIVAALKNGTALPDMAVGLSVDDAYLSVIEVAWPKLKELGYPLTVFVATEPVDRGLRGYMNWDQLRQLKAEGVTIGSQTASHLHMARSTEDRNRADIEKSNQRFIEELGEAPTLIAYPYGEMSLAVADLAKDMGFVAGFGQHSGAIGPDEPLYYLPRYSMNETYGDLQRFKTAARSLALPHSGFTPTDPLLDEDNNPPPMGFTLGETVANGLINCYASHQEGLVRMERLGGERIEIRMDKPLPVGRTRLNCTRLGPDGRWYWLGRQFYRAP